MDQITKKVGVRARGAWRRLVATVCGALAAASVSYGQDDEAGSLSAQDRPTFRVSYQSMRGSYSDEQRNLVSEVTSKVNDLPFVGQSFGLEYYLIQNENIDTSAAWYSRVGATTVKPQSEKWRDSRQFEVLGGYTMPFLDPKTFVLGLRLLTNDHGPEGSGADVTLMAQMAAVVGFNVRQRFFTFWDDFHVFFDGHGYYLMAGGSSSGTDVAGHFGVAWDISGTRVDIALGMVDQSMSSTAKAKDQDGDLSIATHYAANQLMVALWL